MNYDFYESLSVEAQQLINKIKLFVSANTFLKVTNQQSYIKFSYQLNDPSIFYIGKNNDDEIYIKFRELPKVSKKYPGDKVYLLNNIEKVLLYLKEEFGNQKIYQKNVVKSEPILNVPDEKPSTKFITKKITEKEIDIKFEQVFGFALESNPNLHHSEDYPISFWIKNESNPLLKVTKSSVNAVLFNIHFNYPDKLKFGINNPIEVKIDSISQNIEEIVFNYFENFNENLKSNKSIMVDLPELKKEDSEIDFENLANSDLMINKRMLNPRKIYLSSKFKKTMKNIGKEDLKKVYRVLEELENGPVGKEFLFFLKSYQINKIFDFYKIRIDEKKRLVFQYFHSHGYAGMKVFDFIADHEFEYLKDMDIDSLTFTLWSSFKNENIYKIPLLNDKQKLIVNSDEYPSFVFGAAGSGKTSISLEKYLTIYNQLSEQKNNIVSKNELVYLTFNPKMALDMENQIRFFYSNPNVMTVDDFFIDILGDSNIKVQKFEDFESWFEKYYLKAFDSKSKSIAFQIDPTNPAIFAYTYYRGVFKGSLGNNFERSVNEKHLSKDKFTQYLQSENINIDLINALWLVFTEYEKHNLSNNHLHDNDLAFEVLNKLKFNQVLFDCIIIDETQDLTQLQLYTLLKITKDMKIFFYGDSNQTINPTIFSIGKLNQIIYKISEGKLIIDKPYILNRTYRASKGLVEYTNHLVDLRKKWIAAQGEEIDYHHEAFDEDGEIRWATRVHHPELIEFAIEKTLNNPNAIILVPNHKVKEYLLDKNKISEMNQNRIYTIYEAKGLEWESVVLYKFVGTEINKFIEMNQGKAEKSTFHRMVFNKYYVACTRARRTSIIIEEKSDAEKIDSLFDSIHEVKEKKILENYFNNDNSAEAWFNEALNLFNQFEYRKARLSYEKAVDFDSDKVFELIEICNELEKASKDLNHLLSQEMIIKLKERKELDHLINYYRQKGLKDHIKLVQIYKGDQLDKEEIIKIIRNVELDSKDIEILKENLFVKELFQKEEDLKIKIRSVI